MLPYLILTGTDA